MTDLQLIGQIESLTTIRNCNGCVLTGDLCYRYNPGHAHWVGGCEHKAIEVTAIHEKLNEYLKQS